MGGQPLRNACLLLRYTSMLSPHDLEGIEMRNWFYSIVDAHRDTKIERARRRAHRTRVRRAYRARLKEIHRTAYLTVTEFDEYMGVDHHG